MKRIFEFSVALLLLLLGAPLLLLCALAIRLTVSGPVLTARRHKDTQGKSFDVYYFQTPPNTTTRLRITTRLHVLLRDFALAPS